MSEFERIVADCMMGDNCEECWDEVNQYIEADLRDYQDYYWHECRGWV